MKYYLFCCGLLLVQWLGANNISISNTQVVIDGPAASEATIRFDLSWENSWRTNNGPSNWDATWIFVKYRTNGGDYQHLKLTGAGTLPAGATVQVSSDKVGALVYRSAPGTGSVTYSVELLWDIARDGVAQSDALDLKVFGIEMVYVPQGNFYVGDGNTGKNELFASGTGNQPYQITSENSIAVGTATGQLYYTNEDSGGGDRGGPIPADFPKGYDPFYVAKYETSQREWVDFFNTLPAAMKETFDIHNGTEYPGHGTNKANNRVTAYDPTTDNLIDTNRGGIERGTTPMNYVDQKQALAYLDWAGLRPWTELELEKTARGPSTPIPGEFSSGSADSEFQNFTFTNKGLPNSRITNLSEGRGHFIFGIQRDNEANGPLRTGVVSASAVNATRLETGAGYYGAMDISGNLWERVVTIGTPDGRSFVPDHGDGTLSTTGRHNVLGWPAGEVAAYGIKGCAYVSGNSSNLDRVARCAVSARRNAAGNRDKGDHDYALFRGVRSSF